VDEIILLAARAAAAREPAHGEESQEKPSARAGGGTAARARGAASAPFTAPPADDFGPASPTTSARLTAAGAPTVSPASIPRDWSWAEEWRCGPFTPTTRRPSTRWWNEIAGAPARVAAVVDAPHSAVYTRRLFRTRGRAARAVKATAAYLILERGPSVA